MRRIMSAGRIRTGIVGAAAAWAAAAGAVAPPDRAADYRAEHARLAAEIAALQPESNAWRRLERETLRRDALVMPSDRTPLDVVLRRTRALLAHLRTMHGAPDLAAEAAAMDALEARRGEADATGALFDQACELRRRVALKNPLLDFDRILFLTHGKQTRGEIHMIDQYFGFNARPGGGVHVLEAPFGEAPRARDLFAGATVGRGRLKGRTLSGGSFIALDLDFDAQSVAFAWTEAAWEVPADADWSGQHWTREECRLRPAGYHHYFWRPESCYHVFRARLDGTGIEQLTDGPWNEYDPCFLPGGRIAFISERCGSNVRCGARWCPSAVLHAMNGDGSDLRPLSFHETNEWHPSVANDGRIVYTRWDYVDRDNDAAHHLWTCFPDGRDPRAPHGNYTTHREGRPWMELGIRAVPGRRTFMAIAAPHHGENYGSVILIDPAVPDDGLMSQTRRLTPEAFFPESESAPGVPHAKGRHSPKGEVFGQPWPLDEDFFLCTWDPDQKHYALALADSFGNRIVLHRDPDLPCLDPIPLRPRPRPPVIPVQTAAPGTGGNTAVVAVMNVYDSKLPFPPNERVAALRVVQVFGKDNAYADVPRIGEAAESIARGVIGTVPVEADGSAHFEMPAGVEVYFQALDERGRAIQTMRSGTYAHPGESLTCTGCHEPKLRASPPAASAAPLAMRRAPSKLAPGPSGSYPVTFARLVQPVLDRHCVACHARSPKAPDLSPAPFEAAEKAGKEVSAPEWLNGVRTAKHGWSRAYASLAKFGWGMAGGNGIIFEQKQYSIPGRIGARAAYLPIPLGNGHHNVKLSDEEWTRLFTWLDCNSVFYGAYHDPAAQARGETVAPKLGYLPAHAR